MLAFIYVYIIHQIIKNISLKKENRDCKKHLNKMKIQVITNSIAFKIPILIAFASQLHQFSEIGILMYVIQFASYQYVSSSCLGKLPISILHMYLVSLAFYMQYNGVQRCPLIYDTGIGFSMRNIAKEVLACSTFMASWLFMVSEMVKCLSA